jgi:hypothetical protein
VATQAASLFADGAIFAADFYFARWQDLHAPALSPIFLCLQEICALTYDIN